MSRTAETTNETDASLPLAGGGVVYDRFLDCVHCGLCTSACPTYLETGDENDSPRGRIYLMRGVVDGRLPLTNEVERHLDTCLDCRSCETACPSGVEYGRLLEPFRVQQARQSTKRPGFLQRFILQKIFPHANRTRLALLPARLMQKLRLDRLADRTGLLRLMPGFLQRMHRLLPEPTADSGGLPTFLPAQGERRASVALFTGCVADAMFRHVHWATARVLAANGCDVHIPEQQACCGAIHYHSGESDPALAFADQNVTALLKDKYDAVIVNVAGCGSMLKDYGEIASETDPTNPGRGEQMHKLAAKVRDVSEFLMNLGPRPPQNALPARVTVHDACHLVHAQQVRSQPYDLLRMIPQLDLVPLTESDICCGAAGSYNLTQPEMATRLADRKRTHIEATEADIVVSANAGCTLQIQATLKEHGNSARVVHPIELLDYSYNPDQSLLSFPGSTSERAQ